MREALRPTKISSVGKKSKENLCGKQENYNGTLEYLACSTSESNLTEHKSTDEDAE
jgi:hypothetical protein